MTGTLVCDLDGVVFLGDTAVEGAAESLRRAEAAGWTVLFATNNSARTPSDVVAKLDRVTGYRADVAQVITSALVAADMVKEGPVMVVGEAGVTEAVEELGLALSDDPDRAATVIVGLDRAISYDKIHRASAAVRNGARLVVTNRDPTFPTDRGLRPGAGACAVAVETAAGVVGETAGKPSAAMRRLIEERAGTGRIWMVGDRPSTDLALAVGERWRSALVLTGVTSDPTTAIPTPDLVADDLSAVVDAVLAGKVPIDRLADDQ